MPRGSQGPGSLRARELPVLPETLSMKPILSNLFLNLLEIGASCNSDVHVCV